MSDIGYKLRDRWLGALLMIAAVPSASAFGQSFTVLYDFGTNPNAADPLLPTGSLLIDPTGNVIGTSEYGGINDKGSVYSVSPAGAVSVLHSFTSGEDYPESGVIEDPSGNLYGTTYGSTFRAPLSSGSLFKLLPDSQEQRLSLGAPGPANPANALVFDQGGVAGLSQLGGSSNMGAVFTVSAAGALTTLYSFTGGADGGEPPQGNPLIDSQHNIYGVTASGGVAAGGTLFEVSPAGIETTLYAFPNSGLACQRPEGGLVMDRQGNIYGATQEGGPGLNGCLYRYAPNGVLTVVYSFPASGAAGINPEGGLARDASGSLYGVTSRGGLDDDGTVYQLHANGTLTILHSFTGGADGGGPYYGVSLDAAGNIYGLAGGGPAQGVLFKIAP